VPCHHHGRSLLLQAGGGRFPVTPMRCPSCNGQGFLRGFHACRRCDGKGILYPRFFASDETPASAAKDLAWCLGAVALTLAAALAFLFL